MAEPKQRITFTEDVEVLDHNGEVSESYTKGQSVSLVMASARRWLRRGMAVEAPAKTTRKPARSKASAASQSSAKGQPDPVDAGETLGE